MKEVNGTAPIKPYTVKQLAGFYSVSEKTFRVWINEKEFSSELGIKTGHYFNIRQIKLIFDHFGHPAQPVQAKS